MAEEQKEQNSLENKESAKPEEKTENWEKRYKDTQAALTQSQQKVTEQEQVIEQLYPHINWDALRGEKPAEGTGEPEYVDKNTLDKALRDVEKKRQIDNVLFDLRQDNPDLRQHTDLVTFFLVNKTSDRKPIQERLKTAVELTRNLLKSEQEKGKAAAKESKEEKETKEAEASGLETGKTVSQTEIKAETPADYTKMLRERQEKRKLTNY